MSRSTCRLLSALILLLAAASCGQGPPSPVVPDAQLLPEDGAGCVWKVTKPGATHHLFLCGTIHLLREQDYPLAPAYEGAYAQSDRLLLELPPGSDASPEFSRLIGDLAPYPGGDSLDKHLDAATWSAVQAWAAGHRQDIASLARYRPWFVALRITSEEFKALGAEPEYGVDTHFEKLAVSDGKPADGLETIEFQLKLFSGLSDAQQQQLLTQTFQEIKTVATDYQKMIRAWKDGDLPVLHQLLNREAEKFPELLDLFLNSRNATWMDQLEKAYQQGKSVMVLVGSGHLAGETGLVRQFQSRGYAVEHFRGSDPGQK